MYFIKPMLSFSALFLLFNLPLFAQAPFIFEPENINEVLEHIEDAYGSQIEIELDEIYNFLTEAVNDNNYSENCQTPNVNISAYEIDHLAFSWDAPLNDVLYFEHRSLNLYTGASEYSDTDEGHAEYDISSGFYLFLFNSACPDGKVSKANIIIVDKDVMLNGPPELQSCDCQKPIQVALTKSPAPPYSPWPILGYAQINWPNNPNCSVTKYIIDIDDIAASSYDASAFFVHQTNTSPENIFIHPICSHNFSASPGTSLHPGDPGKYHLEFNSNIRVNIEDPSIMANGLIYLTTCICKGKKRAEVQDAGQEPKSLVSNYQNPVYDYLPINISLPQSGKVSIQLLDFLGKPISKQILTNQDTGTHQINIPMSHLTSGIYTCIIEFNNQTEAIKIVKIQ